jgi:hypothetical protein
MGDRSLGSQPLWTLFPDQRASPLAASRAPVPPGPDVYAGGRGAVSL